MTRWTFRPTRSQRLGAGAAALLVLGAAGGAGAVSLTRRPVEMAPTVATAIAKLPASSGVVTVRGRIAAVYGSRFVVEDATGRTLVDAGRRDGQALAVGSPVTVQGRFGDGQLHARFLVDSSGAVQEVGPGRREHDGDGPRRHGPGGRGERFAPPPGGPGAPPPPLGCAAPPPAGAQPAPAPAQR